VRNKEKACAEVGFYSEKYTLPADTTQAQLNALVDELNAKKEINGILCQLPLPPHLSDKEVIARIDPAKDVDAFHPENVGAIMIGISRTVAAEFTFFLAIPVMFGASLLKVLKFGFAFTGMELACLLVGTVISFIVSLFVLRFLMGYIKKHDFKVFGWYRIVLGIIVLLYFLVFA
jgi:hypothetical protein